MSRYSNTAALQTSLIDFAANRRPIALLSVGLVVFTVLGVGAVAHALLPIPWPVAFALGAVVAPPDAVASSAIARRVGMPRRSGTASTSPEASSALISEANSSQSPPSIFCFETYSGQMPK